MTNQDLTLVGLTEDGKTLLLVSDSGQEFRLAADAKLRAALRGENSRLGQLEIQMESALRPRDIQARIRSGETPETVAAAAQTTVDRIMSFAVPVLAERAHVAERAQKASVRRRSGDGPGGLLGDAVVARLRAEHVDPTSVEWDAWRRDDGRWSLTATYSARDASRKAGFVYDAAGRYVIAEDDESRWLVGEREESAARAGGAPSGSGRRLSTVPGDEQLPLGEDAIELVSEAGPSAGPAHEGDTTDLTEVSRTLRAVPSEDLPITTDHADADWMGTQATDRPARRPTDESADEAEPPSQDAATPSDEQPPAPAKKKGRASVPSWDEIMFGSGRAD